MQLVLTNVNGNYKSSVTQTWEAILGDGIIRASGLLYLNMINIHFSYLLFSIVFYCIFYLILVIINNNALI